MKTDKEHTFVRAWIFTLLTGSCAIAADFTGTWIGQVKFDAAAPPQAVCVSMWQGSGVTGRVTIEGQGDSAEIASGHREGNRIEFQAAGGNQPPLTFQLTGDEHQLSGEVKLGDKIGAVALTSYMPKGNANAFGPPSTTITTLSRAQPE